MLNDGAINNNLTRGNKQEIVMWGKPDYTSGIEVAYNAFQGSGWTAPESGIIIGSANWDSSNNYVIVNGSNTISGNSETSEFFLPLSKGDIVTQTNSSVIEPTYTHLTFFPCRGI